ncbi:MAG: ABC transporter substrate-binding protein [Deltaproteobacteria bacterium]|nr:ABC transporter substrate-binding protein [Deltaproteobacteria bacterium]
MTRRFGSALTRSPGVLRPTLCLAVVLALLPDLSGRAETRDLAIVDDLGHRVELQAPAARIIALYGAYNEILAAMGLESRIVGRTKADEIPSSILTRPSIGTHMRPNVEMALGLKPDLILQSAGRREAMAPVNQLRSHGLNVAVFNPNGFEELFSVIQRIGVLAGEREKAQALVDALKGTLDHVARRLGKVSERPKVFFEVRYPNLLAAGKGSIVDDVIRRAGGHNCVNANKKLVRLNMETLIAANPDFYVAQRGPMNRNPSNPAHRPHFQALAAVRRNRVLVVDEQVFSRPGPRSVEAVVQLARFLHPEVWD